MNVTANPIITTALDEWGYIPTIEEVEATSTPARSYEETEDGDVVATARWSATASVNGYHGVATAWTREEAEFKALEAARAFMLFCEGC